MNKFLISLVLLAFVSGCGFHLRGSDLEQGSVGVIFVDASRDNTVLDELKKVLSDRSFSVVENRDEAQIILRVSNEKQTQRIVSVQSTGKVSEFELNHSVDMQVGQSDGFAPAVIDPEKTANRVEVIREYTYDQAGVLGKEAEASIIRSEMSRELVLQIVLRTIATLASTQ